MLSHCLIFLCIGVFVDCKPIVAPILMEAIKLLAKITEESNAVIPKNESMQSVEIPITLEKECASYNLDKYIQALHLLTIKESLADVYAKLHIILKEIAKTKDIKNLKPKNENTNCETPTISINEFLVRLADFLDELNISF